MKVIQIVVTGLMVILAAQSFLIACPTCLEQLNTESIGEVEISENSQEASDQEDILANLEIDQDGFNEFDQEVLEGFNNA